MSESKTASQAPAPTPPKADTKIPEVIFGPIYSRRFGTSLGIDLSPKSKQCNFDCLYCELEGQRAQASMQEVLPLESIIKELEKKLTPNLDVLTITANGEPTLYPHLYELICAIKERIPPHLKTLILSNGSRFGESSVQRALLLFDIVKFSLDGAQEREFLRIDRPHKSLKLEQIKQGILEFSRIYKGELIAEILLVQGVNDTQSNLKELAQTLSQINPKRIDLSTIDRPPPYKSKPLDSASLAQIADFFKAQLPHIPIALPTRPSHIAPQPQESKAQTPRISDLSSLIDLIKRRPLEVHEAHAMLDAHTLPLLHDALESKQIFIQEINGLRFYTTRI